MTTIKYIVAPSQNHAPEIQKRGSKILETLARKEAVQEVLRAVNEAYYSDAGIPESEPSKDAAIA